MLKIGESLVTLIGGPRDSDIWVAEDDIGGMAELDHHEIGCQDYTSRTRLVPVVSVHDLFV